MRNMRSIAIILFSMICVGVLNNQAHAALIVYDDFNGTSLDAGKWNIVGGGAVVVSGGTVTLNNPPGVDDFRSTQSYPIGATVRFIVSSMTGIVGFGVNSSNNFGSTAASDGLYLRTDGIAALFVNGASSSSNVVPGVTSGTFDFVLGPTTLQIIRDPLGSPTVLFTVARPANFDERPRIELFAYSNGTLVVDQVLVDPVPEPGSMAMFGLSAMGLLARRRRRNVLAARP